MLKDIQKVFRALCQPTRMKIALLLGRRQLCVCELEAIIGVSQPAVSQHLRIFKEADLVTEVREGQWVFYSLKWDRLREALDEFLALAEQGLDGTPELATELRRLGELEKNPIIGCTRPAADVSPSGAQAAVVQLMFLCTGNSCRSQMAEGLARAYGGDRIEVHSAGLEPQGVNPRAVQAMREIGIDISGQSSDRIDADLLSRMDYAITLCSDAEERCPLTPSQVKRLHWPLEDPAGARGSEEVVMDKFRQVRDEIKVRVEKFLAGL